MEKKWILHIFLLLPWVTTQSMEMTYVFFLEAGYFQHLITEIPYCYFICLFSCRNLSKLLFTTPLPKYKGIYLCLIRSTGRNPEILIFCLHLIKEQGKGMGKKGRKKFFYFALFHHLPLAGAHVFVCTSPSTLTVEHNTVLTTHAVWTLNLLRCVFLFGWLGQALCFVALRCFSCFILFVVFKAGFWPLWLHRKGWKAWKACWLHHASTETTREKFYPKYMTFLISGDFRSHKFWGEIHDMQTYEIRNAFLTNMSNPIFICADSLQNLVKWI